MERGATVTCIFRFPDTVDFAKIEKMKLYIKGVLSFTNIEKSLENGEILNIGENRMQVDFSQEDTISFFDNEVIKMQFHWKNKDNTAKTSKIIKTNTDEFLGSEAI